MNLRFFEEKFVINDACTQIKKVNWEIDDEQIIIPMASSIITKQQIEKFTGHVVEED